MKKTFIFHGVVLCLLMAGAVPDMSCATRAAEPVIASPGQLSVAGEKGAIEKRNLLLKTDTPVKDLKIVTLDLRQENGDGVFPAGAIQIESAIRNVGAGLITVPVTMDLGKAKSGEFKGQLMISHKGGVFSIPVTVKVKDGPVYPLIFLVFGIALGTGVSIYKSRGKPRDEILVRVEQIRNQMKSDSNMADAFNTAIEARLLDIDAALQSEKWDDAKNGLDEAETILLHWRKGRSDWMEQFDYYTELMDRINNEMYPNAACAMSLKRQLKDTVRNAHEEGPDKFREKLIGFREQANRYFEISAALGELGNLRDSLGTEDDEELRKKAFDYQWQMNTLSLENVEECDALHKAIRNDILAVRELPAESPENDLLKGSEPKTRYRGSEINPPTLISPVPEARMFHPKDIAMNAGTRLRLFKLGTYVMVVVFLAGTGFGELYIDNPIFGANAWGDYFAILGWGFGSETARSSVTDMVKGWGLKN